MSISATAFTNGASTTVTSTSTASKTWSSSKVYFISVMTRIVSGTAGTPTFAGQANTNTRAVGAAEAFPATRLTFFAWTGDGTTSTKTIACGATQDFIQWWITEWDALVTVVQSVANGGTGDSSTMGVTLAAFGAGTATWFTAFDVAGNASTVKASYTSLNSNSDAFVVQDEWRLVQDTTPNMTTGGSSSWVGIGAEVAPPGGSTPVGADARHYYSRLISGR